MFSSLLKDLITEHMKVMISEIIKSSSIALALLFFNDAWNDCLNFQ